MSAAWPYRWTGSTALIGLPVRVPSGRPVAASFAQPFKYASSASGLMQ